MFIFFREYAGELRIFALRRMILEKLQHELPEGTCREPIQGKVDQYLMMEEPLNHIKCYVSTFDIFHIINIQTGR